MYLEQVSCGRGRRIGPRCATDGNQVGATTAPIAAATCSRLPLSWCGQQERPLEAPKSLEGQPESRKKKRKRKRKKKKKKNLRKIKTKFKEPNKQIGLIICSSFFLILLAVNFFQISDGFDLTRETKHKPEDMIDNSNQQLGLKRQNQIASNNNNNHLIPSRETKLEEPQMVKLGRPQRQEEQRRLSAGATVERKSRKQNIKKKNRQRETQGESETSGFVATGSEIKHAHHGGGRNSQVGAFGGQFWLRREAGRSGRSGRSVRHFAGRRDDDDYNDGPRSHSDNSNNDDAAHDDYDLQLPDSAHYTQRPPDSPADNDKNLTTFINGRGLVVVVVGAPETKARQTRGAGLIVLAANKGAQRQDRQADQDHDEMLADDKLANLMSFNSQRPSTDGAGLQTSGPQASDSYREQSSNLDLGHASAAIQLATSELPPALDYFGHPSGLVSLSPVMGTTTTTTTTSSSSTTTTTADVEPDNGNGDQVDEQHQHSDEPDDQDGHQDDQVAVGGLYANPNNPNASIQCESLDQIMATRPSYQTGLIFGINYTLVFVCGLLGNVITLYVLICKGKKCTCQDILIGNLACSDIMLCVFAVPVTPKYLINDGYWTLGLALCKVVSFAQSTSVYMSTYSLICIGYIRYRLIIYPLEESMSKQTALLSCLGTWLVGIIVTLPYMLQVRLYPEACEVKFCDEAWSFPWRFIFSLFTAFFQFMIPLGSVAFFNKKIYSRLDGRRHTAVAAAALNITSGRAGKLNELASGNNNNYHTPSNQQQQQQRLDVIAIKEQRQREKEKRMRKANNRLIFVVVVFAHSWLPLNLYNIAQDYFEDLSGWPYLTATFLTVHLVACSSVCWNPILYAWMSESYRQDLRNALPSVIISRLRCLADPGHSYRRHHQKHSGQHSYISTTTHAANPTHSTLVSSSLATGSSSLSLGDPNNNTNNNNNNTTIRRQLTTIRSHPMEQQEQLDLELDEINHNNNSLVICYDDHDDFHPDGDEFELGDLVSIRRQHLADEIA